MKRILKKMQQPIIALLFLCAAAASLTWLWFTIGSSGEELKKRLETLENKQEFESQLVQLNDIVNESVAEREQLESFILSDENDTIALLSELDAIAQDQGVTLATQELSVQEEKGRFNTLAMRLNISGEEASVMRLIKMLETLPYHGEMASLSYRRSENTSTGQTSVTANVALRLTMNEYD